MLVVLFVFFDIDVFLLIGVMMFLVLYLHGLVLTVVLTQSHVFVGSKNGQHFLG